jgi:hypothetical protein
MPAASFAKFRGLAGRPAVSLGKFPLNAVRQRAAMALDVPRDLALGAQALALLHPMYDSGEEAGPGLAGMGFMDRNVLKAGCGVCHDRSPFFFNRLVGRLF